MIVNRDPRARGPYTAFADVAGAYERGRPGYPSEAVRWLVGDEPRDVVDLGAGTGKLTRTLVALGHRVTGQVLQGGALQQQAQLHHMLGLGAVYLEV